MGFQSRGGRRRGSWRRIRRDDDDGEIAQEGLNGCLCVCVYIYSQSLVKPTRVRDRGVIFQVVVHRSILISGCDDYI